MRVVVALRLRFWFVLVEENDQVVDVDLAVRVGVQAMEELLVAFAVLWRQVYHSGLPSV